MIAKRLFLNHSPSEWFSFIQEQNHLSGSVFIGRVVLVGVFFTAVHQCVLDAQRLLYAM